MTKKLPDTIVQVQLHKDIHAVLECFVLAVKAMFQDGRFSGIKVSFQLHTQGIFLRLHPNYLS
jgi:hypothetical protein